MEKGKRMKTKTENSILNLAVFTKWDQKWCGRHGVTLKTGRHSSNYIANFVESLTEWPKKPKKA